MMTMFSLAMQAGFWCIALGGGLRAMRDGYRIVRYGSTQGESEN